MVLLVTLLLLTQLSHLALANLGLLAAKTPRMQSHEETFCMSYVSLNIPIPDTKAQAEYFPLLDLHLWNACNTDNVNSTIAESIRNKTVIVNGKDCPFIRKGMVIQRLGGAAVISSVSFMIHNAAIANSTYLSGIKIPMSIITSKDGHKLKEMGPNVSVKLYIPKWKIWYVNWSLVIIWLFAMTSISLGATYGHFRKKILDFIAEKDNTTPNEVIVEYTLLQDDRKGELANVNNEDRNEEEINDKLGQSQTSVNQSIPSATESQQPSTSQRNLASRCCLQDSKTLRIVCYIINAVIFTAIVVLTYYFYGSFVYFFIGIFIILSMFSVYWITLPVVQLITSYCRLNAHIPCFGKINIYVSDILSLIMCVTLSVVWCVYRNEKSIWLLHDILGMAVCITVISYQKISNLKVVTVVLIVFFVYDVFLVFITPFFTTDGKSVMEKLVLGEDDARSHKSDEEMPTILKVPYMSLDPRAKCWDMYYILGLGDIIIPGFLFLLCFDFGQKIRTQKVYLPIALVGYGIGLVLTDVFLTVTKMGQPALLYLVPCSLLPVVVVAMCRKELGWLWHGRPQANKNGSTYFEVPHSDDLDARTVSE